MKTHETSPSPPSDTSDCGAVKCAAVVPDHEVSGRPFVDVYLSDGQISC